MAPALDVTKHLEVIGIMGRHQWLTFFTLGFLIMVFGWDAFMIIFVHNLPAFRCADEELGFSPTGNYTYDSKCDVTMVINNVTITKKCEKFVYDNAEHGVTAIERFDLVCENNYISTLIEMLSIASVAIGMVGGSYLSDRFGRKIMCITPCILTSLFGVCQAFSVNAVMYAAFKILCAIFSSAIFSPVYTLMMESVSTGRRSHVLNGQALCWIAGTASLSLIAYLFKSWWKTQLFCSAPGIAIGFLFIWTLDESPHWLVTKGKTKEALAVLEKMARWNRVDTDGLSFDPSSYSHAETDKKELDSRESFLRIWVHKRIVVRFLIFSYGWFVCSMCYYALSFGVRELPGDIYINNVISAVAEALAYLACFVIAWWGRKWPTIISFVGGAIALLVQALLIKFAAAGWAVTSLSMLGKLFITAAWQIIIIWETEMYPTTHRCILVALNSLVGRGGAILAPFILDMDRFLHVPNIELIMPITFVIMMVIGGFLYLIPPETNRRRLPEFIKEANKAEFPLELVGDGSHSQKDELESGADEDLLEAEKREQKQ